MVDASGPVRRFQVRIYEIQLGKMGEFLRAWRNGVVPLRQRFGFSVHGAWIGEDGTSFVWILSHAGPQGFEGSESAYYESSARRALEPDPGQFIKTQSHFMMRAVDNGNSAI